MTRLRTPFAPVPPILILAALAGLSLSATPAQAYNPPVDTAGPLTVRIEGPEEVAEAEAPVPVRVVLENKGNEPIEGTLELEVIDRWRIEPGGPVQFSVEARGTTSHDFRAIAGQGTYSAHYPIHAYARFASGGRQWTAHPILILETKLPQPPRAPVAIGWKAFAMPESGELALWRLPAHRSVVAVFGEEPITMPVGWQGSEPRSRGSVGFRSETLAGQSRSVLVAGAPPEPSPFPPKDDAGSRLLGTAKRGSREYEFRVWPGRRGLLDAVVGFRSGDRRLYFHGFEIRVLGGRIDDGYLVRHRFRSMHGAFELVGHLFVEEGALEAARADARRSDR